MGHSNFVRIKNFRSTHPGHHSPLWVLRQELTQPSLRERGESQRKNELCPPILLATCLAIRLPLRVRLQNAFDHKTDQVNNVVVGTHTGMLLLKQFDMFFQVRSAITQRGDGGSELRGELLELTTNDFAGGRFDGCDADDGQVVMSERASQTIEIFQRDRQDNQTLRGARIDRVIEEPDPILSFQIRSLDQEQADAKEM